MIHKVFPSAQVDWRRINYAHRDGARLKLNITEHSSGLVIGSVVQSEMEPGNLGPGAKALAQRLELFKEENLGE